MSQIKSNENMSPRRFEKLGCQFILTVHTACQHSMTAYNIMGSFRLWAGFWIQCTLKEVVFVLVSFFLSFFFKFYSCRFCVPKSFDILS